MPQENEAATKILAAPLIFISHDSRDADLAEAFSNLLRSVSAGMLKSFRSSDRKGTEGIEFGDEWYKRLMEKLVTASDVVCLLTERSLGRPWILYEAGVAKGKLDTPVHGVALGVPLSNVSGAGPFYQFQNSDDSEESLKKLVSQLCRRVPGLEPDETVITAQVQAFRKRVEEVLSSLKAPKSPGKEVATDIAGAKVLEEMKSVVRELSMRLEQNIAVGSDRTRMSRRLHPGALMDVAFRLSRKGDPVGILVIASPFKNDMPWIYETASQIYRIVKTGKPSQVRQQLDAFSELVHSSGEISDIDDASSRGVYRLLRELPDMMHHLVQDHMKARRTTEKGGTDSKE